MRGAGVNVGSGDMGSIYAGGAGRMRFRCLSTSVWERRDEVEERRVGKCDG